MASDRPDSRRGVTRLLPWWYVDLDAEKKRNFGSLTILIVLIPCLVVAWISSKHASGTQDEINSLLASRALSHFISVRLDRSSIVNIIKASVVMGVFVEGYRLFIPISNVLILLIAIIGGGLIYILLILKIDRKIHNNLKTIITQMNP